MKKPGKKGNAADIFVISVIFLVLAIFIITLFYIQDGIRDQMGEAGVISTENFAIIDDATNNFSGLWDGIFVFVFVGLVIATIIGAALVRVYPAIFFISLFLLAIAISLSAVFSNVFEEYTTGAFSNAASEFPMISHIMGNWPIYITVIGILILIVLYAKGAE